MSLIRADRWRCRWQPVSAPAVLPRAAAWPPNAACRRRPTTSPPRARRPHRRGRRRPTPPRRRPPAPKRAPPRGRQRDAPRAQRRAAIDLAKLRAEYDRLRDELFRARARAAAGRGGALRLASWARRLRWKGAPDFVLHRAEMRLDGNDIWDSGEKPVIDDLIKVAERPIKPGPHALTRADRGAPRARRASKEHDELGYDSEQTFVDHRPRRQDDHASRSPATTTATCPSTSRRSSSSSKTREMIAAARSAAAGRSQRRAAPQAVPPKAAIRWRQYLADLEKAGVLARRQDAGHAGPSCATSWPPPRTIWSPATREIASMRLFRDRRVAALRAASRTRPSTRPPS